MPLVVKRAPADSLRAATARSHRHVVDIQDDASIAGEGNFVTIDAGTDDGIAPGNILRRSTGSCTPRCRPPAARSAS